MGMGDVAIICKDRKRILPRCTPGSIDAIHKEDLMPAGFEVASTTEAEDNLDVFKSKLDFFGKVTIARLTDGQIGGEYYESCCYNLSNLFLRLN